MPTLSVRYQTYLVVYLDLLGQSDKADGLRRLPNANPEDSLRTVLDQSAIPIKKFRDQFLNMVDVFAKINVEGVPRALLEINQIGFSDSFIVSVPLEGPEAEAQRAITIAAVMSVTAGVIVQALAHGVAIRGGLAIGYGINLYPQEVYGPPLTDAYRLESQVAEYPRVAIARDVGGFLETLMRNPSNDRFMQFASMHAGFCRNLVIVAPDDGWPMLHLMAPHLFEALPSHRDHVIAAHSWVRLQVQNFGRGRNEKLYRRYVRLLRYFDMYHPESKK